MGFDENVVCPRLPLAVFPATSNLVERSDDPEVLKDEKHKECQCGQNYDPAEQIRLPFGAERIDLAKEVVEPVHVHSFAGLLAWPTPASIRPPRLGGERYAVGDEGDGGGITVTQAEGR